MSKYHSRKITRDGVTFDSVREYNRFKELQLLERAGKITRLNRQIPYELIPTQYETITDPKTGKKKRVCVERSCSYVADFTYWEDGKFIVEDAKGMKTESYRIKRKLMLSVYGIRIKET